MFMRSKQSSCLRFLQVAGTGSPGLVDGPARSAQLNGPWGIVVDPNTGDIYWSENNNHVVRKLAAINNVVTTGGHGLVPPRVQQRKACALVHDKVVLLYKIDAGLSWPHLQWSALGRLVTRVSPVEPCQHA